MCAQVEFMSSLPPSELRLLAPRLSDDFFRLIQRQRLRAAGFTTGHCGHADHLRESRQGRDALSNAVQIRDEKMGDSCNIPQADLHQDCGVDELPIAELNPSVNASSLTASSQSDRESSWPHRGLQK
jgi:hypothetical protein